LPITRGGNALAVRAEHFFATSAVTADALFAVEAMAVQINPANRLANLSLVIMDLMALLSAVKVVLPGGYG
jgi:hypothetical protein